MQEITMNKWRIIYIAKRRRYSTTKKLQTNSSQKQQARERQKMTSRDTEIQEH